MPIKQIKYFFFCFNISENQKLKALQQTNRKSSSFFIHMSQVNTFHLLADRQKWLAHRLTMWMPKPATSFDLSRGPLIPICPWLCNKNYKQTKKRKKTKSLTKIDKTGYYFNRNSLVFCLLLLLLNNGRRLLAV